MFSPGTLYRLTGIHLQQLNNGYIDAEAIFSGGITEVNDKLNDAKGYVEMIAGLEEFLMKRINHCTKELHRIDSLSNMMLRTNQSYNIESLAAEGVIGPSPRPELKCRIPFFALHTSL